MAPEQQTTSHFLKKLTKPCDQEKQPECLHHLFEAQVRKTPHAVAVVFEAQHLTYAELDTRANQFAHHLQHDTLVGIFAERSLEMVVALYATLKGSGAYYQSTLSIRRIA